MNVRFTTAARLALGATFTFAGLNGMAYFLGFDPLGPNSLHVPEMQWLVQNKWLFAPEKAIEVVCGLLLLLNRRVPVALLALFPVSIAIFLFHLLFDRDLLLNGIIVVGLLLFLMHTHREEIKSAVQLPRRKVGGAA